MFILGRAHQSHPAKHVLGSTVGGGWPLSQAQPWVANKSSAQPGSPCAGRQTPEGGRPWPGLTRPGPVRLAKSAAATLTNTPLMISAATTLINTPLMIKGLVMCTPTKRSVGKACFDVNFATTGDCCCVNENLRNILVLSNKCFVRPGKCFWRQLVQNNRGLKSV
jgi:hypothetical protein